jgi:hypothetical protein
LYLGGLGGFWVGWGLTVVLALVQRGRDGSAFIFVGFLLMFGSFLVLHAGLRRLDVRIKGDKARPWPRGPSLGTQLRATLPAMMSLAARRLGLRGPLIAGALYAALILDAALFVRLISRR